MDSKVDLIFVGSFKDTALTQLLYFFRNAEGSYLNSPEVDEGIQNENLIIVINTNDYIDYVINSPSIEIAGVLISNVFVNICRDNDHLELLLFFDLKDLQKMNCKTAMDELKDWSIKFRDNYCFTNVRCQIDNGRENEFYFVDDNLGPFYNRLEG